MASLLIYRRKFERLKMALDARRQTNSALIEQLKGNPTQLMTAAGYEPDDWQRQCLEGQADRMLLLCSRQAGKSRIGAALALHTALTRPNSPILLLSPSQRQSAELFRKVMELVDALKRPF